MTDPLMGHVLEYATLGWLVIPLWSVAVPDPLEAPVCTCPRGRQCTSPGKHPRLPHGVLEASSEPAQLGEWWQRWPDANVGIATGPRSGIYVVDLDGPAAVEAWAATGIPSGWQSRTGNGVHHVYALADDLPNTAGKIAVGIDTRGAGGYIVAPPSVHYRRLDRYAWIHRDGTAPPALPDAVRAAVTPTMATAARPPTVRFGESSAYARGVLRHALERVGKAGEGTRNETLTKEAFLLGQWIGGGELDPSGVAEALERAHPTPCDVPKVRSTILRSLRDGAGYPRTKADENP
jgi:hypothetical protein